MNKTYALKQKDIVKDWRLIDADGLVLGRMASHIAHLLRGKHKPYFSPHLDCGDYVVVVNADKVHLTGNKFHDKKYYWHTGFPGGIKETTPRDTVADGKSERLIIRAVKRMLPRGPLGAKQLSNLRVFAGAEHTHGAHKPVPIDFKALNDKNVARVK